MQPKLSGKSAPLAMADACDAVMATLLSSRRALWPVSKLRAEVSGLGREELLDVLSQLIVEGRLECWADRPGEPSVILSSLAAKQAGLELDDAGRRWRERSAMRRPHKIRMTVIVLAEKQDKRGDCPEYERMPRHLTRDLPTVLLGERLIWEGPAWLASGPCPGCRDKPGSRDRYCLCCERRGDQ